MSSTRDLAREAAFEMLMEGTKPSVQKIREHIGQGSDKTILDGLNEFWAELGQLIQDWRTYPKLPNDLAKAMNEWWHLAMKQAHKSMDSERKDMVNTVTEAKASVEVALLEKEQLKKQSDQMLIKLDELTAQFNEIDDNYQIQLHENTRLLSENATFKKEQQRQNKQIKELESNHKDALKLAYERAQETEENFAKQIDSWKKQAEKTQSSIISKEKEFSKVNKSNLNKIEKLYKTLNESEETNQKNLYQIDNLKLTVDKDKKLIQQLNHDIQRLNTKHDKTISSKDKTIQSLQKEVTNLKEQLNIHHANELSFEKSQSYLDKKFNQLLETIKSQGS